MTAKIIAVAGADLVDWEAKLSETVSVRSCGQLLRAAKYLVAFDKVDYS